MKNQKDSGKGSLRKALADAEDGDRVKVPAGLYKLKSGALVIDTDIEVTGAGSKKTVIDARQRTARVLEVSAGATRALGAARSPAARRTSAAAS